MAVHPNPWSLAAETIEEYLLAARHCLSYKKLDGGCLGYPSVLLLLCVVNALGTYLRDRSVRIDGKNTPIARGEPFRVLNHSLFGLKLAEKEIKKIEARYRNMLAHNGMIATQSWLLPGKGSKPFIFEQEHVAVYVESFYDLVVAAWKNFDKSDIQTAVEKKIIKVNH